MGKTKAFTSRFIYSVVVLGINSSHILCVAFTNKGVKETRKRVKKLVEKN
ncbi:UvrD-helicase domain-containing protein [Psychroflexus torquis]